ncbi:hypothetical protein PhCBS80983_g02073 [Powellomyces hirtus]|uniref:Uncharacterized protein n=1 Tax=Powellomyces hirtus TaxID=109895 RepID=A0A507EAD0_9FUNG|nr:hypothetical protein PhCBS80983_g02073 [Powellomyces hirtus]
MQQQDQFSVLVAEAVAQSRNGRDNTGQLQLVLALLTTERQRQEEIRKTKELELEILKLEKATNVTTIGAAAPLLQPGSQQLALEGVQHSLPYSGSHFAQGRPTEHQTMDFGFNYPGLAIPQMFDSYDDSWMKGLPFDNIPNGPWTPPQDVATLPAATPSSSADSPPLPWFQGPSPRQEQFSETQTPLMEAIPSTPTTDEARKHSLDSRFTKPRLASTTQPARSKGSSTNVSRETQSSRKKIEEEAVYCKDCEKLTATFVLHYEKKHNMHGTKFTVELICSRCEGHLGLSEPPTTLAATSTANTRKRTHDDFKIDCEICKRRIGSGGFKFAGNGDVHGLGSGGKLRDDDGIMVADAMNFRVEPICAPCKSKYRLCTECGGGGKFRTGKYRPVELFAANRRTCNVSHVRIGGAPLHFEVFAAPFELTEKIMSESREVHMDGFSGLYMCPEIIEVPDGTLDSYDKIATWAFEGWKGAETLIRHDAEKSRGLRKYVAAVYVDAQQNRMRGSTVKRIQATYNTATASEEPEAPATLRFQVGYMFAEWDIANGALLLANGYIRTMNVSTLPILRGMAERILRRAMADQRCMAQDPSISPTPPALNHIWLLSRKQHARLTSMTERLGFVPLDEYLKLFPHVDKNIFLRDIHVPRSLFLEVICSVPEYLRETGGR